MTPNALICVFSTFYINIQMYRSAKKKQPKKTKTKTKQAMCVLVMLNEVFSLKKYLWV